MTDGWIREIDAQASYPARTRNDDLGGKDNLRVDRETAELALAAAATPHLRGVARRNHGDPQRAVRHLAGEAGIRQIRRR